MLDTPQLIWTFILRRDNNSNNFFITFNDDYSRFLLTHMYIESENGNFEVSAYLLDDSILYKYFQIFDDESLSANDYVQFPISSSEATTGATHKNRHPPAVSQVLISNGEYLQLHFKSFNAGDQVRITLKGYIRGAIPNRVISIPESDYTITEANKRVR